MCVPACLCVCHISAGACRSQKTGPVELVFPGSELPTAGAGNQI